MEKQSVSMHKKIILPALVLIAAVGISLNWAHLIPAGSYSKVMGVGSSVCHQISSHSYIRDGMQFPLCARCSGLYLGCFIGLVYAVTQGKKCELPKRGFLLLALLLFLLWAGDGVNSFISDFINRPFLYATTNTTRLITGFGMGLVLSTALMTLFNLSVWKDRQEGALLEHFWQLAAYALLATGMSCLLVFGSLITFQILAYLSTTMILVVISMLYTIFWVIILKKDNSFEKLQPLTIYLIAGFATAMLQVTLMTTLRSTFL